MAAHGGPDIPTDDLVLCLDAASNQSYSGTGTTWYDLSNKKRNSTIVGATWNSNGYFEFDGSGERDGSPTGNYVTLNTTSTTTLPSTKPNGVTYQWWFKLDGEQAQGHSILYGLGTINHLEWRGTSTGGSFRTEARTQNGYSFGASAPPNGLNTSYWAHMTIVFANDEVNRPVRWYKNGELFHTGNMTSGNNPTGEYFIPSAFGRATGSSAYLYAQSFLGKLSQFLVYDRTLTDSEILKSFNARKSVYDLQ